MTDIQIERYTLQYLKKKRHNSKKMKSSILHDGHNDYDHYFDFVIHTPRYGNRDGGKV